jgi:hypothetical protein
MRPSQALKIAAIRRQKKAGVAQRRPKLSVDDAAKVMDVMARKIEEQKIAIDLLTMTVNRLVACLPGNSKPAPVPTRF